MPTMVVITAAMTMRMAIAIVPVKLFPAADLASIGVINFMIAFPAGKPTGNKLIIIS